MINYHNIRYNENQIILAETLRELKKLLGLKAVTFLSALLLLVRSTFLVGQGTIFFCINVILTGFFTYISWPSFFYALTSVNPFDFVDRSDRAVLLLVFGETNEGNCFDSESILVGLYRLELKGVFGKFYYVFKEL